MRGFFSSCGKWGPLFIAVRGPLTVAASLVAEHRLQTRRLSNCGSRAQLLRDMWDLPRPGLEPVSPALAGRFSTTVPPGKPRPYFKERKNWLREVASLSQDSHSPSTLLLGSHPFMSHGKYTHIPYYINLCVCILVSYELAFTGSLTYYYILSAFDLFQISLYSLKPIHFFLGLKNLFVDSHKGHRPQELHLK